jgi:hypothetical protein
VFDRAASIARHTGVLLDSGQRRVSTQQLARLDTDGDAQLTTPELAGYSVWSDLNENGVAELGETVSMVRMPPPPMPSSAAGWRTQPLLLRAVHYAEPSGYRLLRDSDNVYGLPGGQFIAWAPSQVKINSQSRDALIGTDGNDRFDASYYSAYTGYFNLGARPS